MEAVTIPSMSLFREDNFYIICGPKNKILIIMNISVIGFYGYIIFMDILKKISIK